MSSNTRNNAISSTQQQEVLKNVTTTNEQQPPNKFILNTEKVSGKPLPARKTQVAKISYGKDVVSKENTVKVLQKEKNTNHSSKQKRPEEDIDMESSPASQQEDFAKKKQERDQEIMEIQEMLNKMKSPQKCCERSSQESTKTEEGEAKDNVTTRQNIEKENEGEKKTKEIPFFGRCKTEFDVLAKPLDSANSRITRRDTVRSSSNVAVTNKARSRSSQLPLSAKETKANKKLNYNPEEARRYMEMQRKQRKESLLKDPSIKSKVEKEEIKKRLEELKKNTRKLVYKSLQKKEKLVSQNVMNRETEDKVLTTSKLPEKAEDKEQTINKNIFLKEQGSISYRNKRILSKDPQLHEINKTNTSMKLITDHSNEDTGISHRSTQSLNNVLTPASFPFNKRIGLLRKTENDTGFSLTSHRNYNFNKENQNLQILTKQLTNPLETKVNKDKNNTQNKEIQERKAIRPKETPICIKDVPKQKNTTEIELTENNLKSNNTKENQDSFIKRDHVLKDSPKPNELPYWLRPSTTQVYPYNFIMAVRRKLESIAPPSVTTKQPVDSKQNQETSTTDLNYQLRQNKRKLLEHMEQKQSKKVRCDAETPAIIKENIPEARAVKQNELKQLKPSPQQKINEENANIQASQFSQSNKSNAKSKTKSAKQFKYLQKSTQGLKVKTPQKNLQTSCSDRENNKPNDQNFKLPSNFKSMESLNSEINSNLSSISLPMPISNTLTEVSSLITESGKTYIHSLKPSETQSEDEMVSLSSQIFSSPEKKPTQAQDDFVFVKPRAVSPLSLEKVDKLKIKRMEIHKDSTSGDKEMDFTQLLEDFNRSLSQVIQVNEQLKSSLDKSQHILSPQSSKKSSDADKYYSSDFEKTPTLLISTKENNRVSRSLQESSENLQMRKRQLFEIAEKVKPLLTPLKSENKEEHKVLSISNLNLSIETVSHRTTTSTEEENKITQSKIESGDQTSSSLPTQSYEERLQEIAKLKETLKQTILESQKKRAEKEPQQANKIKGYSRKEIDIESLKRYSQNKTETYSSGIPSVNEIQQSKVNPCEISTSNKEIFKSLKNESKDYEKYQKQSKNNEKIKTTPDSESLSQKTLNNFQNRIEVDKNLHSIYNPKNVMQSNHSGEKSTEMTDYSSLHSYNIPKHRSINSASNEISQDNSSSRNNSRFKNKVNDREGESKTSSQSEADSTSHIREISKSKSVTKSHASVPALSSSIAEDLQKTFESGSYENENMPFNTKTNTNENLNERNDSAQFIKCHINRSRGDFQETISEKAQFNETQFQQAIEAASQISSTENVQSADDEITSSVASKRCFKPGSNSSSYNAGKISSQQFLSTSSPSKADERIGSEIVKFFKQYDSEKYEKHSYNNESLSESSLNYSNVGLYEKLIQNETNKTQHLTALLKMREKALLDRTKGQIAWLEVQKARYKAKGLINHIAAIKKKQRGILLKMDKEREEIKRLLYTTTTNSKSASAPPLHTGEHKASSQRSSPIKHKRERLPSTTPLIKKPKSSSQHLSAKTNRAEGSSPILKATYELESSRAVEELLKKREEDLRKRREHVERLMQWHQRLDEEEAEVLNLERQLLSFNNAPNLLEQQQSKLPTATTSATEEKLTPASVSLTTTLREQRADVSTIKKRCASRARKMEKRLKEIDKSLKDLSHISASSTTSVVMGQTNNENEDSVSSTAAQEVDFVRTTGVKLNKLWKRLTSQQIEKFEPTRRYKLCKSDLERLYEEAKMAVLRDFAEDEERIAKELLEKSVSNLSSGPSAVAHVEIPTTTTGDHKTIDVPMLNLNFSSGHSEAEEESANNSQHNTTEQGNYSPSVAEENFKAQVLLNSSVSSETTSEQPMPVEEKQTSRLENNVQMFLALSQRIQASGRQLQSSNGKHVAEGSGDRKLQRSLSDTEISDVPKYKGDKTFTSQKNIGTASSQSNSSIITNSGTARSFDASAQHQRSKSSIVETTYIPSTQTATQSNYTQFSQTPTHHTDNVQESKPIQTRKDLENVCQTNSRSSVICSVGTVTPIKTSQHTSSDIASISEDLKSSKSMQRVASTAQKLKQKSTYSGQVGTNSETTAKEIASKLDEISAAVIQLSQMNSLPSYESVAYSHLRNKSIEEPPPVNTNDESNLSTDVSSSYSLNFENITTDKHSSPGTSTLNTHSLQHATLASKTYTHTEEADNVPNETNETKESNSSITTLHTHAGTSTSLNSTKSKTFVKDGARTSSQSLTQSLLENRILDAYEADFESDLSNVTHIEDITIPTFETSAETTQDNQDDGADDDTESFSKSILKLGDAVQDPLMDISDKLSDETYTKDEVKNSLSPADSGKSMSKMGFKSHTQSPEKELLPPPPPLPPPSPPPLSSSASAVSSTTSGQSGNNHLMPDIINELELRRHQLILDNEHLKQYEHVTAVPYMYVREIPNKPPPPYVPPAHGSPMTTIFPSEDRIKDITFRRTHELYCELLKTEYCSEKGEKLPSVMEEQITNIYERIILDICREYLEEHGEILRDGDPRNFHSQLAFFNPPNRLRCIQDAIYKEVRACLAMDKIQPKRAQIYSVYGQRAKQDHIGKIIIQEMYDEDDRWCNFHHEESEVLHLMVEEMINKNIVEIATEVLLEEGGTIDAEETQIAEESGIIDEENTASTEAQEMPNSAEESIEPVEKKQQQTQLETSSILMETVNEDDRTYCVNETEQQYSDLKSPTNIETAVQENFNVKNTNIATSPNAVQTCT